MAEVVVDLTAIALLCSGFPEWPVDDAGIDHDHKDLALVGLHAVELADGKKIDSYDSVVDDY